MALTKLRKCKKCNTSLGLGTGLYKNKPTLLCADCARKDCKNKTHTVITLRFKEGFKVDIGRLKTHVAKLTLMQGDCLERMKEIPDKSIDAIICDPPYGTTACKWDSIIPLEPMWEQLNRIIKPNGAIVLFGSEPFSSLLRVSNLGMYKYDWKWEKDKGSNYVHAKYQPLKNYEDILIFSKGGSAQGSNVPMVYNRQYTSGKPYDKGIGINTDIPILNGGSKDNSKIVLRNESGNRSPLAIQKIPSTFKRGDKVHPTQKPVALMEYLIKTYTNENELVLDFTMGSGTTGVACKNLGRRFIGIELDEGYFEIAKRRIDE